LRASKPVVHREPLRGEDQRHQCDGQQHHQQAEAVEAERVVDAEGVDPVVGLLELHAPVDLVGDRGDHSDDEGGCCHAHADQLAEGPRRDGDDDRADQREPDQGAQHQRFTATRTRTRISAPTSTDSAYDLT
jgi:hypothetical protein